MPKIELSARQEALLRLPDPSEFIWRIAAEVERDSRQDPAISAATTLLDDVATSYDFATFELGITRIPTLVRWVKLDATSNGALRKEQAVTLKLRASDDPNFAAEDILSLLTAQTRWGS